MSARVPRPRLVGTTICYPLSVSPEFTLERALEGLARAGLRYVELAAAPGYCDHLVLEDVSDAYLHELADLLARYGLTAEVVNVGTDLTTDAGIRRLAAALYVCQALGVHTLVTAAQQTDTAEGMAAFQARVPVIDALAAAHEALICLETHRGYLNTGKRGVTLLRRLDSDRFRINYDMANVLNRGGVLPEVDLRGMGAGVGRYIGHVHLKDKASRVVGERRFTRFGEGVLDFGAVLAALDAGGYRGQQTLEVELDGEGGPAGSDAAVSAAVAYLEQFWLPEEPPHGL